VEISLCQGGVLWAPVARPVIGPLRLLLLLLLLLLVLAGTGGGDWSVGRGRRGGGERAWLSWLRVAGPLPRPRGPSNAHRMWQEWRPCFCRGSAVGGPWTEGGRGRAKDSMLGPNAVWPINTHLRATKHGLDEEEEWTNVRLLHGDNVMYNLNYYYNKVKVSRVS
jgi:hypothetical protein